MTTMKRILLFLTLSLYVHFGVFAQRSSDVFDVVNKLKNYVSTNDPEKVYLQFDKPYYAAGDTIYFKAYVTQGGHHKLSTSSGVLHVDLINTENSIDQSIRLRLDSGICWGDFALSDSLPTGNYRIRAYTQWMQNRGGIDFFDQPIAVGSIMKGNVPDSLKKQPIRAKKNKVDIQFFPEGGTLVEGVRARMAFKATGTNGLGTHVKGVILDKSDKPVCSFESQHLGMGYFVFIPEKGNAYKAKLSFEDGTQSFVDLTGAESSGISLSVIDDSASTLSIRIMTNTMYYQANQGKEFLLVIYSGGKAITYSYKLDAPIITLNMERKVLQTGVSTISLFSQDGEPLCERLFFVQNNDQLRLQIQTDKTVYKKKEKVDLLMNAKNPSETAVKGRFSMTIIDESLMPWDEKNERNILTDLLLISDLKGYVEQPNYYFKDTSEEARKNLDLLMLTQGYRHFEWKQVLGNDSAILAFQPEKGIEINGKITTLSDKPISHGTVTLILSSGGPLLSTISDGNGLFHFSNLVFTDTARIVLSAVNAKGDKYTRITYFNKAPAIPVVADAPPALQVIDNPPLVFYMGKAASFHEQWMDTHPGMWKMLKPVTVKAVKPDNPYRTQNLAAGHADQVMHADEIEQVGGKLSTSLNGRLRGVNFIGGIPVLRANIGYNVHPMLLVLDGIEIKMGQNFNIDDLPSSSVATIEVLMYASESIYGVDGANGVLVVTTKNGSEARDIASVGVLPITPYGFYKARTFYSPKYDYTEEQKTEPELRSTIYWNPEIKTDLDGHAILNYYNADSRGTYKVIVEGIDQSGNIGRMVYRYQVE
jgi:hypothetical protein